MPTVIWDRFTANSGESWEATDGRRIDQLANAVELLRRDPDSRRIVVSAWNVGELERMRLLPCHVLFQFYVADGELSCQLYQRSADLFLGSPVQHRQLCPADPSGRPADRSGGGRIHLDRWRLPSVSEPPGAGSYTARPRTASAATTGDPAAAGNLCSSTVTRISRSSATRAHPAIRAPVAI